MRARLLPRRAPLTSHRRLHLSPFTSRPSPLRSLYDPYTIWKFTLLWTLTLHGAVFLFMGLFTLPAFSRRHFRLSLLGPVAFVVAGTFGAFLSATIVGYALAALYNANFLRMSTWVPALWGAIQTLILVSASFSRVSLLG